MKKLLTALLLSLFAATPISSHTFWQYIKSSTTTDSTTAPSPTNISGLGFDVGVGTYTFKCYLLSKTATNATNGIKYAITGPADPTTVALRVETPGPVGAATNPGEIVVQHYYANGAAAYTGFLGSSSDSLTTYHFDILEGVVNNTVAGTVQIQVDSESTETVTVSGGSWCLLETPRPTNTYSPQG